MFDRILNTSVGFPCHIFLYYFVSLSFKELTFSWRRSLSCRNQSIDLQLNTTFKILRKLTETWFVKLSGGMECCTSTVFFQVADEIMDLWTVCLLLFECFLFENLRKFYLKLETFVKSCLRFFTGISKSSEPDLLGEVPVHSEE